MKHFRFFMIVIIFTAVMVSSGCSQRAKNYNKQFVTTFAELSLLYEKEKMMNKTPDSLYQVKVNEFFGKKGTTKEDFKHKVDELSHDVDEWKEFLQDVSKSMDSLRMAK